jgi:hypothetical protein
MKKTLLFCLFLFFQGVQSQLIVNPNPFGMNSGTITVTYGSAGDYSLFDPLGDPNLYLYTGLETDGVTATWDYHDIWTNPATLVPLTWNSSLGAYVATLNLATRSYFSEFTQTSGLIPTSTYVNNWYFLIRNFDGTRQSADLIGTNYGFTPSTLSTSDFQQDLNVTFVKGNVLNLSSNDVHLDIYFINGQKINSVKVLAGSELNLNLTTRGIYLARIISNDESDLIKFIF